MINVALGSVPKDGGTFTFYRNIRPALILLGVDIRCVALGKQQAVLWEDAYADEGCVLLASKTRNIKKQAQAFVEWCEVEQIDIVMAINSEAILSALPHLPEHIRVVSRCANAFDHGYRITMSGRERLAAIVALTPRLEQDLVEKYGADPSIMHLIPNGIDPLPFENAAKTQRGTKDILQLGFLGRLEHTQKGVFHLPEIVKRLDQAKIPFKLQIAGKGKHGTELSKRLHPYILSGQVEMIGAIPPIDVPSFLQNTDIYLFPSHFEGCPNALLEALMAGSVCMAWRIEGITDFILEKEGIGFLYPLEDYDHLVKDVKHLNENRSSLDTLSKKAGLIAREHYNSSKTAKQYASVFATVMNNPPPVYQPRSWKRFKIDKNFDQGIKRYIPPLLKELYRNLSS